MPDDYSTKFYISSTNANVSEETANSQKREYKYCTNEPIKSGESKFKVFSFEPPTKNDYFTQRCIDFWKLIESRTDLKPAKGYNMKKNSPAKEPKSEVVQEVTVKEALDFLRQKGLVKLAMQPRKQCKMCVFENARINYGDDFVVDDRCFSVKDLDDFKKITYETAEVQTDPIYTKDISAQVSHELISPEMEKTNEIMKQLAEAEHAHEREMRRSVPANKDNLCTCQSEECMCSISIETISNKSSPWNGQKVDECSCSCSCTSTECLCLDLIEFVKSSNAEVGSLSQLEIENCPCSEMACACLEDYELIMQTKWDIKELLDAKLANGGSTQKCLCSCKQENCPCQILINLHDKIEEILIGYDKDFLDATPPYAIDKCECENYCTCLDYYKQVIEDNIKRKNENVSSLRVSTTLHDQTSKRPEQMDSLENIPSNTLSKQFSKAKQKETSKQSRANTSATELQLTPCMTSNNSVKPSNLAASTTCKQSENVKEKSFTTDNVLKTEEPAVMLKHENSDYKSQNTTVDSTISQSMAFIPSNISEEQLVLQASTIRSPSIHQNLKQKSSTASKVMKVQEPAIKLKDEKFNDEGNLISSTPNVEFTRSSEICAVTHGASILKRAESLQKATPSIDKKQTSVSCADDSATRASAVEEIKRNESHYSNVKILSQNKVEAQCKEIDKFLKEIAPCKSCFENEISFKLEKKASKKSEESQSSKKSKVSKSDYKAVKSKGSKQLIKDEGMEIKKSESFLVKKKSSKTNHKCKGSDYMGNLEARQMARRALQDNKMNATSFVKLSSSTQFKSSQYKNLEIQRTKYSAQTVINPKEVHEHYSKTLKQNEIEINTDTYPCALRGDCRCNKNANQDEKVAETLAEKDSQFKPCKSSKSDLGIKRDISSQESHVKIIESCSKHSQQNQFNKSRSMLNLKNSSKDANEIAEISCGKAPQPDFIEGQKVCGIKTDCGCSKSAIQAIPICRTVIITKENHRKLIRCEPNVVVQYKSSAMDTSYGDCNCLRVQSEHLSSEYIDAIKKMSEQKIRDKMGSGNSIKATCHPKKGVFTCRTTYTPAKLSKKSGTDVHAHTFASLSSKLSTVNEIGGTNQRESAMLIKNDQIQMEVVKGGAVASENKTASNDFLNKINSEARLEMPVKSSMSNRASKMSCNVRQTSFK